MYTAMSTAKNKSGYVDNWQTGKTVTECNLHMLTSEDCSDVIFRVGSEKHVVRAHRYVLVSRSCVFHAMFCGPLAEKGEVTIPDVEPHIFKEFLRCIYTDAMDVTVDNVVGLLYTSRKYDVGGMVSLCSSFLETSMSEENVCQILEQCHHYGEVDLEQKALKMLMESGEKVAKSAGFTGLCTDCLERFLKSNQLRMKEEQIFEATLSWTKRNCPEEDVPVTNETIKKCLGDLRHEIGFGFMSLDFLANVVGPSEFLTSDERVRIMDKILGQNVDISPFRSTKRKANSKLCNINQCLPWKYVNRYRGGPFKVLCSKSTHAVSFFVSESIYLLGCQMYGPFGRWNIQCNIGVKLVDARDNVISEPISNSNAFLTGHGMSNSILFPDPIHLISNFNYTLYVELPLEQTWYGSDGRKIVNVDGVDFVFADPPKGRSGTTVREGQIPGLIFHKVN